MNVFLLKRYPLVLVFLLLQVFVLVAGIDRQAWPFVNYPMYARLDSFKNWHLFVISGEDRNGKYLGWPEVQRFLAPYSKPVDLNFFLNKYPSETVCGFFTKKLEEAENVEEFFVSLSLPDVGASIPFLTISRERGCVQAK